MTENTDDISICSNDQTQIWDIEIVAQIVMLAPVRNHFSDGLSQMKSSHTTDCHKWNFVGWKQIWNVLPSQDLSWWRVFSSNKSYLANLVLLLLIQLAQFRHKRNDKELSLSSSTRAFNHLQTSFGCWMRWALCTHEEEKPVRETDGCIHECKKDLEKDCWCCIDWKRKTGKTS